MPLLGSAAILLAFDVAPDRVAEHDDWHTHEHLPERLSIPGFLRGSRWAAVRGQPRYLVLYEVADLATLTSAAYLERLNHPSAWTSRLMPHYRGMTRGLCSVVGSTGLGMGNLAYAVRFNPPAERAQSLREWLLGDILPKLPEQRGLGSAHLLQGAAAAPPTNEQRIRGADAGVDWALLATGYDAGALCALERDVLGPPHFARHGVPSAVAAQYGLAYSLTHAELGT
jgi:hypothetical protein